MLAFFLDKLPLSKLSKFPIFSASSESMKDKKQGRKVSDMGPSFMKRTAYYYGRPQPRTLATLFMLS